jgi:hypothetical protein
MATNGTYTAFQQLRPLEGSIVDDMTTQEQLGFNRRAEQRQVDKIAKEEEEKKTADRVAMLKLIKSQKFTDTGSKSKNEFQLKMLSLGQEKYKEIIPILSNPKAYSDEEYIQANLRLENLNKLAEKMDSMDKGITAFVSEADKDIKAGKYWEDPKFKNHYQTGYENKVPFLDENFNPAIAFIDKNNDGLDDNNGKEKPVNGYFTYEDMESGVGIQNYKFEPRYSKEQLLAQAINKIKPEVNQVVRGSRIIETTGLNKDAVNAHVQELMFDQNGNPTDVLKSLARENNIPITDAKGLKAIKDDFINSMSLYAPGGVKESVNSEARQWAEFNYKKSQDGKKEQKEATTYELVENPVEFTNRGIVSKKGYKTVAVKNSDVVKFIGGKDYKTGKSITISNGTIDSYTVIDKAGKDQIIANITYEDTKAKKSTTFDLNDETKTTGSEMKNVVMVLSPKNASLFANNTQLKNVSTMMNKAKFKEEAAQKKPKTIIQNGYTYTLNSKTGKYE